MVCRVIVSVLVFCLSVASITVFAQERKDQPALRLSLPPSQPLSWTKPVKCIAIASAALYEEAREMKDFKTGKLSVYVKKGTDRLRLWLEDEELVVQPGDQKPDRYRVSGHQNGFLVAIHHGGLIPAAYSISVNEKNGFAIWSLSEPMLVPSSEYPYGQTVYMQCTN